MSLTLYRPDGTSTNLVEDKTERYTSGNSTTGFTTTLIIQGHVARIIIRGTSLVTLNTQENYSQCGSFSVLKGMSNSVIKRTFITARIYGQIQVESSTGIVKIGYTKNMSGEVCSIPVGEYFYMDETFII